MRERRESATHPRRENMSEMQAAAIVAFISAIPESRLKARQFQIEIRFQGLSTALRHAPFASNYDS